MNIDYLWLMMAELVIGLVVSTPKRVLRKKTLDQR